MPHKVGWVVDRLTTSVDGTHAVVVRTTVLLSDNTFSASEMQPHTTEDEVCPSFCADLKTGHVVLGECEARQVHLVKCVEALSGDMSRRVKAVFALAAPEETNLLPASELRGVVTEMAQMELSADAAVHILKAVGALHKGSRLELGEFLAYCPGIFAFVEFLRASGELVDSATPTTTIHGDGCAITIEERDLSSPPPPEGGGGDGDGPLVAPVAPPPGEGGKVMTLLERAVLTEINIARALPHVYAEVMDKGCARQEGTERRNAWAEGAAALKKTRPLAPVREVPLGLYLSAKDHALDQSVGGTVGHAGSDGSLPSERCSRYGSWNSQVAEALVYGARAAKDVVSLMLADPGHREQVFGAWSVAAVAFATHPRHGCVCVVSYAGGYCQRTEDAKLKRALHAAELYNAGGGGAEAAAAAAKAGGRNIGGDARKAAVPAAVQQAPRSRVKVYGREACGQCRAMHDALNAASIPFQKVDIDKDRAFFPVMTHCGFRGGRFSLPVVVIPEKRTAHWEISDPFQLVAEITAMMEKESQQSGGDRGRRNVAASLEAVDVYALPGSQACSTLTRLLDDFNVSYNTYDLSHDWSCLRAMLESGYAGGPVTPPVAVSAGKAYYNVPDIRGLAQALGGQAPGEASDKLAAMLAPRYGPAFVNHVVDAFKSADSRGDGTMDKDELQRFLHELYTGLGFPTLPDEIQRVDIVKLFRKLDADRNQNV